MTVSILTHGGRLVWEAQVQDDTGLSDAADIAVAAVLARFHNSKTGRLNPAVATIAKTARVGLNAARHALKRLAARGHLLIVPVPGGTSRYVLVLKAATHAQEAAHEATGERPAERPSGRPAFARTPHTRREGTPHTRREDYPSRTGVDEPQKGTFEVNPAPLAPKDRNAILITLNRYDSLHERPHLYAAIRKAGMTPAAWGSETIKLQIVAALQAGAITL